MTGMWVDFSILDKWELWSKNKPHLKERSCSNGQSANCGAMVKPFNDLDCLKYYARTIIERRDLLGEAAKNGLYFPLQGDLSMMLIKHLPRTKMRESSGTRRKQETVGSQRPRLDLDGSDALVYGRGTKKPKNSAAIKHRLSSACPFSWKSDNMLEIPASGWSGIHSLGPNQKAGRNIQQRDPHAYSIKTHYCKGGKNLLVGRP